MATALHTPKLLLMYPTVFTPRMGKDAKPGDKPKYSCTGLILPKDRMAADDQARLAAIKKACFDLACEKIGRDKAVALLRDRKLKLGFRDDIVSKGYPEDFVEWIQPWTFNPPGVVGPYKDPSTGKAVRITDPKDLFSGCWGRMSVVPFYYDREGNKGVGMFLNNIMKTLPPEGFSETRLAGQRSAEDDFEGTEDLALPPEASLSDVPTAAAGSSIAGGDSAAELAALLG